MEKGIVDIGNLTLESGIVLENVQFTYERVGRNHAPTVLICQSFISETGAFGADATLDVWNSLVGQGKSIDTNRFSVISFTGLGEKEQWSIRDRVLAERKALTAIGVHRVHAVIGHSLGGIQVIEWGIMYPDDMDLLIPIAAWFGITKHQSNVYRIIKAKVVALAFTQDELSSTKDVRAFTRLLSNAYFYLINTNYGHDGFIKEPEKWEFVIKHAMEVVVCRQSKPLYSASAL